MEAIDPAVAEMARKDYEANQTNAHREKTMGTQEGDTVQVVCVTTLLNLSNPY
jgi:hypothetical protein